MKRTPLMAIGLALTLAASCASTQAQDAADEHWARPVETGPSTPAEALYPETCALCHAEQYRDWKGALHSRSAGPGLLAQLAPHEDPETALSCYFCHAPLAAQSEMTLAEGASGEKNFSPNPSFDKKLMSTGVNCAACHVRGAGVAGPPMQGPSAINAAGETGHVSVQKNIFKESAFCAACHQLENGYELNGKPLVNTFNEWKESEYSKKGITCQGCHMPTGKHLFRGIHDTETVKSAVRFDMESSVNGNTVVARLRITNTGAGHLFPTYATPLVAVRAFLTDTNGKELEGTAKETAIGRKVSLDLETEFFDTRIPPLGSFEFNYETGRDAKASTLVFEVQVYPDEFYNRFFENALENRHPGMNQDELMEALKNTRESNYTLFRESIPLDGPSQRSLKRE